MPGLVPAWVWTPLPSPRTLPGLSLSPQSPPASGRPLPSTDSPWSQAAFALALLQGTHLGRGSLQGHVWPCGLWLVASHLCFSVEGEHFANLPPQGAELCCGQKPCLGEQHSQQQACVSGFQAWRKRRKETKGLDGENSQPPEAAFWLWQEVWRLDPKKSFPVVRWGP